MTEQQKFEKWMAHDYPEQDLSIIQSGSIYWEDIVQVAWSSWNARSAIESKAEVVKKCKDCINYTGMEEGPCLTCYDPNLANYRPEQTAIDRLRDAINPFTSAELRDAILELADQIKAMEDGDD